MNVRISFIFFIIYIKLILIFIENWIFYFEKIFNVVKIESFNSTEDLIALIKSESIDAVAIDYRLTEHNSSFRDNGDFFFKEIRKNLLEFPVFILTRSSDEVKRICKTVDPSFIMDKENINFGIGNDIQNNIEEGKIKITLFIQLEKNKDNEASLSKRIISLSSKEIDNKVSFIISLFMVFSINSTGSFIKLARFN